LSINDRGVTDFFPKQVAIVFWHVIVMMVMTMRVPTPEKKDKTSEK
jgi:hypothetical protein